MSKIKAPAARPSPNDQSNLDMLASLGIHVNRDGSVQSTDEAFQGTATLGTPDPGYTGTSATVQTTQDVHTYDRLEEEEEVIHGKVRSAVPPRYAGLRVEFSDIA